MSDPQVLCEYLRRSYTAVDGLWFVKLEERFGFDTALQIDQEVWLVAAKIQARKAAELACVPMQGLESLQAALALKFEAEQYEFSFRLADPHHLHVTITRCPWFEILAHAGRTHLAPQIVERICRPELAVWAGQFGCSLGDSSRLGLCTEYQMCQIVFEANPPSAATASTPSASAS